MSVSLLNFRPYLPEDAGPRLKVYQYHGSDKSYIYKYLWKPLCAKSVTYLPMWLAPNVITVTALVLVIITHFIMWWYLPNLQLDAESPSDDVPSLVFVLTGIALFAYQYLDNMDGQQARRTGTSSPLGLLMDHGCDAFNAVVGSLSVAAAVQAGPTWKSWAALMCAVIVFFLNTWEEYYRGELVLPIINGANEGILIAIAIYFITAFFGPNFWVENVVSIPIAMLPACLQRDVITALFADTNAAIAAVTHVSLFSQELQERVIFHIYGTATAEHVNLKYNTVAILLMVVSAIFTALGNFYQVWSCVNNRGPSDGIRHGIYGDGWLVRRFPFVHALTRLVPLLVVTLLANTWFFISPDNIFQRHPRIFCWTIGMLYTKLAIHLMIAHLCAVEFHPFRRTLVPFFYIGAHVAISYFAFHRGAIIDAVVNKQGTVQLDTLVGGGEPAGGGGGVSGRSTGGRRGTFDEEMVLLEFFALSAVTLSHLAVNAILETATVLGVPIFTIRQKVAAKKAQ